MLNWSDAGWPTLPLRQAGAAVAALEINDIMFGSLPFVLNTKQNLEGGGGDMKYSKFSLTGKKQRGTTYFTYRAQIISSMALPG